MAEAIYVKGISAKKSNYGVKISGKADKLIEQIQQHTNSKGYINFELKERREVGQYGDTHSLVIDTWEPTSSQRSSASSNSSTTSEEAPAATSSVDDDLPF